YRLPEARFYMFFSAAMTMGTHSLDGIQGGGFAECPLDGILLWLHTMPPCSMKARISSTFQAVQRMPILTGWGYLPAFTPFHQVDLLTGKMAGIGGCALLSPMIVF